MLSESGPAAPEPSSSARFEDMRTAGAGGVAPRSGGRRRAGPISTRKRPISVEGAGVIRGAGRRG